MTAQVIRRDDGGIEYTAAPRRRTGKRLIDTFAEAAQQVRQTESGQRFVGLICPGMPWIYWSMRQDHVHCERCDAKHTTPMAVDPVDLATRFLIPFSSEHKGCSKKVQ
jgi:hypothetical protein